MVLHNMQIGLAQDFIASQLKDTKNKTLKEKSLSSILPLSNLLEIPTNSDLSFYLKITLLRNQINLNLLNVAIKTTSRTKFASIVPEKFKNNLTKPVNLQYTIFTFVFAHKTPRLRDSFLKGSTSQEHDGNDDFHVSPHVPSLPPPPFFDRVQRPTPRCVERCIDQHRSGDVRSAVMWRWIWLPAKAVFVDKCPFNREQVSLFTLCFLCFSLYITVLSCARSRTGNRSRIHV